MSKHTVLTRSRTTRPLYRMEHTTTAGGGQMHTRVDNGHEEIYYTTEMDLDALQEMARKAAGNKSGKSIDGPVIVTILERRKL